MLIDRTPDNTAYIGYSAFKRGLRGSRAIHPGMRGLGDIDPLAAALNAQDAATGVNTEGDGQGTSTLDYAALATAANSEVLYITNLVRQASGQTPINPATAAPTVNVGLSAQTQTLVKYGMIAAVGVGLLAMFRKRRTA
jgi:hypothetical protein